MNAASVVHKIAAVGLMLALAAGPGGCAAGSYGSLHTDPAVTKMFESGSVPENYRYFSVGRAAMPYAIVGLAPPWQLDSAFWEKVDPTGPGFAGKVSFIWDPHVWYQFDSGRGAWIRAPGGEEIGIWYSMYPDTTVIVHKSSRTVEIYTPHRISEDSRD